ncbi:hypothetical protein G7084_04110 [Weissella coleopterorum]|uniref:Uncharacterized protein n=1 Tax=Weissella coleopterorum TaxID=2714949 RepID=A0A6G8AZS7_9LACO|nr:hypothetical protein [Weissella coleopterorum]QIL50568.1 hypothetical protein G7084_04110 [Weissella coleopterorum]
MKLKYLKREQSENILVKVSRSYFLAVVSVLMSFFFFSWRLPRESV